MSTLLSSAVIDEAASILGSARRTALLSIQESVPGATDAILLKELTSLIEFAERSAVSDLIEAVEPLRRFIVFNAGQGGSATVVLDAIADIESLLLSQGFNENGIDIEMFDTLDSSFRSFDTPTTEQEVAAAFDDATDTFDLEIDEELMEVFREEADELLSAFGNELEKCGPNHFDEKAKWEMRRIAHTFKGAAGAVGLTRAAELTHRIEDDLGTDSDPPPANIQANIESIKSKFDELCHFISGADESPKTTAIASENEFTELEPTAISNILIDAKALPIEPSQTRKSVVRISIDALDQLDEMAAELNVGFDLIADLLKNSTHLQPAQNGLYGQIERQLQLATELSERIESIRLVEFGTLTTRLQRAVRVACEDGLKTAEILIENQSVRVDTIVLDALVEPLMHLLRNAVVHGLESSENRRLLAKAESGMIRIAINDEAEGIKIEVSDDGRGININALKSRAIDLGIITQTKANEMSDSDAAGLIFHKGLSTASELSLMAGRGVGMNIVREAIESLGGKILVRSRNTFGTTFSINLPKAKRRVPAAKPVQVERKISLLTVDDSGSVRLANRKVIEACGFDVAVADGGHSAIALLKNASQLPDMIITDLEMPEMNGFELIGVLKSDPRFRNIPVVVLSTRTDSEYRTRALRLGAEGCIQKPLDNTKLTNAVAEFCQVKS
ncbi:MAG: hybrid sensor histidine kinase/response regulator [Pyrinomonadaceae bacterium]